mgnify:CR=1 FL=1
MTDFRVIVAGMGVQGAKRQKHAGADCVACVEPAGGYDFNDVRDVPLKVDLLGYLADNG